MASDESASQDERTDAIHELRTANECDELERLVRRGGLETELRREALHSLAVPQCDASMRELLREGAVGEDLREEAEELLEELEGASEDTGAGP